MKLDHSGVVVRVNYREKLGKKCAKWHKLVERWHYRDAKQDKKLKMSSKDRVKPSGQFLIINSSECHI